MTDIDEPDRAALTLFDDIPRTETRSAGNSEPRFIGRFNGPDLRNVT